MSKKQTIVVYRKPVGPNPFKAEMEKLTRRALP